MPIDSFAEQLIITRQATLVLNQGPLDLIEMGDIADATTTTTAATGQVRQTGKGVATEVTCTVNMSDPVVVAQVNVAFAQGRAGMEGHITRAGSITYYNNAGQPKGVLYPDEMQITGVTTPGTSVADDGQEARLTFILSVWRAGPLLPA